MQFFSQACTSIFLVLFGCFLSSPIFASNIELSNPIILGSNFSDTCNWTIQCNELPSGQYICHTAGESLSTQGGNGQSIPVGKYGTASILSQGYSQIYSRGIIQKNGITYIGPDTYVYPFVRITKIQV